jgi:hypothetical protein
VVPKSDSGIGIGGSVRGLSIFCGLMLTIGLVWVTLSHLNDREKVYEARITGALKFLDGVVATSREYDVSLYAPKILSRTTACRNGRGIGEVPGFSRRISRASVPTMPIQTAGA